MSEEQVHEDKKYLTREEMGRYDAFHYRKEILDLKFKLLQEEHKRRKLEAEVAELRQEVLGHRLADNRRALDKLKTTHKDFDRSVRERLEIEEERFGFHPETGEIALSK
jgi:hypothetical protein